MSTSDEIVHKLARRRWWDGAVVGMCGQVSLPGHFKECWFDFGIGRITCPDCRKAMRN